MDPPLMQRWQDMAAQDRPWFYKHSGTPPVLLHSNQACEIASLAMEETPHDVGLHDEDEKRSVLKKVKDKAKNKAKKLKDTLKLHGHGHNHHEEGRVPDDHDLDDEEDDEDEQMVDDPEIHGAYGATKSSELDHEKRSPAMEGTDPMNPQLKVAVERTSGIKEVPRAPTNTPASITPGIVQQTEGMDRLGGNVQEQEVRAGKPELNLEGLTSLEEDPHAPKDGPGDYIPSNYQSKVADPTGAGGEAAGISQVLRSLDEVSVSGDGEQGSEQILSTGSHDQISPEPIKQDNTQEPGTPTGQETSRTDTLPVDNGKRVASTMTEKLGPVYEKVAEAGHMVTEKLSPVYQKVSEAGSTVLSKVHGKEEAKRGIEGQDKGVSVKDYIAEKFRPREEDKALSEVISDALHRRKEKADEREKQIGKVTESEEVRRQLGSHSDGSYEEGKVPSSAFIPGKGVVGKVKGAVGSWFGKGEEESRPSQQSLGSSTAGPEGFSTSATAETGERRLQEVGN
ncbi:hypothetical protein K2173_026572 [Erythroxylum novogranatense]|uniref:Low-temperature-induced 65 kDa protein n=1 Tax=Erythroxylum novogranatense TaxID=1862640 RepID=A0AAV8TYY5_9ROSI|nr:hypothetical protein K2173_026572 [Erythroxylum novogranatense]